VAPDLAFRDTGSACARITCKTTYVPDAPVQAETGGFKLVAGAGQRFEVFIVVPMTADRGQRWSERSPALYPRLEKNTANLRSPSICLLDQIRSIGAERVRGYRGTLDAEQYRPIHDGLRRMMSHDGGEAPTQITQSAD
jgi:mRNA-degrading endonuclease toxin of MazEF toxin-antitoxin module